MDWSKEDVLLLVDLVRRRPCLYDKEHESYNNAKLKIEVARELSTIIASTRPGTTVKEVYKKWEEVCAMCIAFHKRILAKKKPKMKPFFIDKMEFMKPYLDLPLKKPASKKSINGQNIDSSNEQTPESGGRASRGKDRYPCLEILRVSHSPEQEERNRASVSAISIVSDESAVTPTPTPLAKPGGGRKRKLSTASLDSSLGSPLVNVNDSILDRTEPLHGDYRHNANSSSFASRDTAGLDEDDEDHMYVRYIACKLKKLEGSQKLNFKLSLERLFYDSMNS